MTTKKPLLVIAVLALIFVPIGANAEIQDLCYEEMKAAKPGEYAFATCKEATQASYIGDSDRARSFVNLAWGYRKLSKWKEAYEASKGALEIKPKYPAAKANLAAAAINLGQLDEAEAAARDAVFYSPNYGFAQSILVLVLANQGRVPEAIKVAQSAVSRVTAIYDRLALQAFIDTETTGDLNSAESMILRGLAKNPELPSNSFLMGSVYFHKGDYQKSIEFLRKAIELGADSPGKRIRMAEAYRAMGDVEASQREATLALALKPRQDVANAIRAGFLDESGEAPKAPPREAFKTALKTVRDTQVAESGQEGASDTAPWAPPPVGTLMRFTNRELLVRKVDGYRIEFQITASGQEGFTYAMFFEAAKNSLFRADLAPLERLWPLEPGKSAEIEIIVDGSIASVEYTVEKIENVTVPAGIFRAFVISSTLEILGRDLSIVYRHWYAPKIGTLVRVDSRHISGTYTGQSGRSELVLLKPPA